MKQKCYGTCGKIWRENYDWYYRPDIVETGGSGYDAANIKICANCYKSLAPQERRHWLPMRFLKKILL